MHHSRSGRFFVVAALLLVTGCMPFPIIKPEAFTPTKPKVAIIGYRVNPVEEGTLGLPIPIKEVDTAYAVLASELADSGFELVPTERIRDCREYFRLPRSPLPIATTPRGLDPVFVSHDKMVGLAECVGSDIVVLLDAMPEVEKRLRVLGVDEAVVRMTVNLEAYDNRGERIWLDTFNTDSESFVAVGSLMSPEQVEEAGLAALTEASRQAVQRFNAKLQESAKSASSR